MNAKKPWAENLFFVKQFRVFRFQVFGCTINLVTNTKVSLPRPSHLATGEFSLPNSSIKIGLNLMRYKTSSANIQAHDKLLLLARKAIEWNLNKRAIIASFFSRHHSSFVSSNSSYIFVVWRREKPKVWLDNIRNWKQTIELTLISCSNLIFLSTWHSGYLT